MLASLLPGLRDVRTPLTVGYLWLLILWLAIGDRLPTTRPDGDGLVARLFDLADLLGTTATIAALGFVAYVLGAYASDARLSASEYRERQQAMSVQIDRATMSTDDRIAIERLLNPLFGVNRSMSDLRARLLVANQEMYGEYDRLSAEAAFRINLVPPLIATAVLIVNDDDPNVLLALGLILGAVALLLQGATRLSLSKAVLQRAVLSGVINDQVGTKVQEILQANTNPPADVRRDDAR